MVLSLGFYTWSECSNKCSKNPVGLNCLHKLLWREFTIFMLPLLSFCSLLRGKSVLNLDTVCNINANGLSFCVWSLFPSLSSTAFSRFFMHGMEWKSEYRWRLKRRYTMCWRCKTLFREVKATTCAVLWVPSYPCISLLSLSVSCTLPDKRWRHLIVTSLLSRGFIPIFLFIQVFMREQLRWVYIFQVREEDDNQKKRRFEEKKDTSWCGREKRRQRKTSPAILFFPQTGNRYHQTDCLLGSQSRKSFLLILQKETSLHDDDNRGKRKKGFTEEWIANIQERILRNYIWHDIGALNV